MSNVQLPCTNLHFSSCTTFHDPYEAGRQGFGEKINEGLRDHRLGKAFLGSWLYWTHGVLIRGNYDKRERTCASTVGLREGGSRKVSRKNEI